MLLGIEAAAEDSLDARPSHHDGVPEHDHEDFDSIVCMPGAYDDVQALVSQIEELASQQRILRVKGYADIAGKPMRLLVQAVGGRVRTQFDRMWASDEIRQSRLVVIAEHDDIDSTAISAVLKGQ